MTTPRVSVLMTTRDGAAWLRPSLDCVFAQTMDAFELIVVDDGSVDATPAILASYADPRLRVLRHDQSRGIAGGRNIGLALCRAPYIAMLDHDDLSDPGRLAAQVAYLDAHPATVLLGAAVRILRDGVITASGQPARVGPAGLRFLLHMDNPLTWSSIMLRRSALAGLGDAPLRADAEPADDFDLYHRLLAAGDVARLDEVLTTYRWHAGNTTHRTAGRMAERAALVLAQAYAPWFGAEAGEAAALVIRHLSDRAPVPDAATLDRLLAIIGRVEAAFGAGDEIRGLAAGLGWRLVRAAIRDGRPWLLSGRWPRDVPAADPLMSAAIGTVRAASWQRRRTGR